MNDLQHFEPILNSKDIISQPEDMKPHLMDWRGQFDGTAQGVLFPRNTEQVAQIMAIADTHNLVIVPQGGNTGLVGGGIPDHSGQSIILSLAKMNKVRELSVQNRSMIVESGCILEDLHKTAEQHDLYFPLNLAAKGSCTIGGNLSTNAGGVNVVRYGNTRDLCLGVEVVLLGGRVMNLLSPLRKDNTGYDLKHLFIGSEGTLGIITASSCKLFSLPKVRATALVGIKDIDAGVELLGKLQTKSGEQVEAFELMPSSLLEIVFKQFPSIPCPLSPIPEFMVLMEIASSDEKDGQPDKAGQIPLHSLMEEFLAEAFEDGLITDATIAQNETQRQQLWDIREHGPESTKRESTPVNTDISVRRSDLAAFYETATHEVRSVCSKTRICGYGHMGDGNLHFNLVEAEGGDPGWTQKREALKDAIYRALDKIGGSISAEHGIGQLKIDQLQQVKDPVALDMMTQLKSVFDPKGLLNPGKVVK